MLLNDSYRYIDLKKTGRNIERLIRKRGYSVKDIQYFLHLSCPQPVYRWIRGQILPSVDHLYVLAEVLQVYMEELLVTSSRRSDWQREANRLMRKRMSAYGKQFLQWKAA